MDIDWVVAIMVFLVFVGWSFSYYFGLFPERGGTLKQIAGMDRDKIVDFLSADVYTIPVKVTSAAKSNAVLNASSVWYYGTKNSTKVFSDVSLPCRIVGDDLYWLANLSNGDNYFYIEFSETETPLNCDSSFSLVNVTQTIPWALEKRELISLSKINEMTNMSYDDFKNSLGMEEDFSLTLEWEGAKESYGKSVPGGRDVYVSGYKGLVWENSEGVNISVKVW